jgi:integrase
MGVKVRKRRGGKWYIVVDYKGRRKTKCIGTSRAVAEEIRRKVEAQLALGDCGVFADKDDSETFDAYSERWFREYAALNLKESSVANQQAYFNRYVKADFGKARMRDIRRDQIKTWLAKLATSGLARNTVRLALSAFRVILSHAVEDGIIEVNPASRLGRFTVTAKPAHDGQSMSKKEVESFLNMAYDRDPDYYVLFLVALRCGLRQGELIALKWMDVQLGADEDDQNRYIFVQRNCSRGKFTTPKSKHSRRRVDLSRQVRKMLAELKDRRLLEAMMQGRDSISDDLVFPARSGEKRDAKHPAKPSGRRLDPQKPLDPANLVHYHYQPTLEAAGLRHFRFHDLRHTFGSLLAQAGAPLVYIKEQMGHSSIVITANCYAHLQPAANVGFADSLDAETKPLPNGTPAQQVEPEPGDEFSDNGEVIDAEAFNGGPGRTRTYNQQIMSLLL